MKQTCYPRLCIRYYIAFFSLHPLGFGLVKSIATHSGRKADTRALKRKNMYISITNAWREDFIEKLNEFMNSNMPRCKLNNEIWKRSFCTGNY